MRLSEQLGSWAAGHDGSAFQVLSAVDFLGILNVVKPAGKLLTADFFAFLFLYERVSFSSF